MAKIHGGFSACSTGPVNDPTPEDMSSHHIGITDSPFSMTNFGPPYAIPPQADSAFSRLEHKLEGQPGVTNPGGLAYKIGEHSLGKEEMARRAAAGRKD